MENILGPIIGIVGPLWSCTKDQASYCMDLEGHLRKLRNKKEDLQTLYDDMKNRVELEERQQLQRTNEVNHWLLRVEARVEEAKELQTKVEREVRKKCLQTCPKNCVSSYRLGKKVKRQLNEIDESYKKGQSLKSTPVAVRPVHPPPVEIPIDKVVGTEMLFEDVWRWVEDESVRVIGIYGMGGVGKTHLLTQIYNHFSHMSHSDRKYDYIFFITVGKEGDPRKIQRDIWRKLNIFDADNEWERMDLNERAARTLTLLREKKSLLFLDDIWESIDVHEDIGIPQPTGDNLESKIIFTTRSEQVCEQMRVHKSQKVPTLPLDEAIQLFKECVGEKTVEAVGSIPEFVEIIKECKGLPLAIKTVGKAMAGKRSTDEWKHAMDNLKNSPWNFPRMKKEVFNLLMFSYERLPDETHRQCFLSCALYPEDCEISRVDLVQLWVVEGLLDTEYDGDVVRRARDRGNSIVSNLVQACMLEAVTDYVNRDIIRMHDLVRDMALWIVQDNENSKNKILVQQPFDQEKWEAAEKISFRDSDEEFILPIQSLSCPNLHTLILRYACIRNIPCGFFSAMPSLRVLDLRGNLDLVMLPDDIGELINLQSLDLSVTNIHSLPQTMQNLKKLRYLLLPYVQARILKELMSNFTDLRLFGWSQEEDVDNEDGIATIEALERMKHLCEVSLTLSNSKCMEKFLACPKLLKRVSSLHITRESFHEFWSSYGSSSPQLSSSSSTWTMDHLELLDFSHYEGEAFPPWSPNQVRLIRKTYCFSSLKKVKFYKCGALVDLTWLIYNAPKLERLVVRCCSSLLEVIKGEIGEEDFTRLFTSLIYLELNDLPCLNSICRRALAFPLIRTVMITRCPSLKKLPFNERVVSTLLTVSGERAWWNALQWDLPSMKEDIEKKVPNIWIF